MGLTVFITRAREIKTIFLKIKRKTQFLQLFPVSFKTFKKCRKTVLLNFDFIVK